MSRTLHLACLTHSPFFHRKDPAALVHTQQLCVLLNVGASLFLCEVALSFLQIMKLYAQKYRFNE